MSARGDVDPDWLHEAPFYLTAIIAHGALLTLNPVIRWGAAERALDKVLPIEFVADVPLPPSVNLAPTPRGDGTNAAPRHGPGAYEPEQIKRGAARPTKKQPPKPRPAAVKSKVPKTGAARRLATAESRRLRAEAKAAKARKRAELSSTLATISNPDEELQAGAAGASTLRKDAAAAALAASPYPGDASGSGGGDLLDAKPRGGGAGPEGGGVSWSVDGPVGSRRILSRASPASPDWVATRNLDLTVTLRFQVLPDGSVKPGAIIQKTSGFPDIDGRALEALRRWRFQPVPAKSGTPEVWGRVTFRFTS